MTRHIKNLFLSLISFIFIISFLSCSGEIKKIDWTLIADIPLSEKIVIGIRNENGNKRDKSLTINKTKLMRLKQNEKIFSLENDSSLCVILNQKKGFDVIEIYVYPCNNYTENETSYIVEPAENVEFYYIESFDYSIGKNYMIISRDNIIDKNAVMNEQQGNLEYLLKNFEADFLYYNADRQELALPYSGYIMKSKNFGDFVFLSSFWGQVSFIP